MTPAVPAGRLPADAARHAVTTGQASVALAAALAAFWCLTTGTRLLAAHDVLAWRTPVLALAALAVHVSRRSRSTVGTAALHLAAIVAGSTDLLDVGSWAIGWPRQVAVAHLFPAAIGWSVIAVSTLLGWTRFRATRLVPRLWPVAVLAGLAGTALTIHPGVVVIWAMGGAAIALAALVWAIDLFAASSADARGAIAWPRHVEWWLAVWVFAASAIVSRTIFDGVPHVPDEVAMWLQAKYFAAGHLGLAPPPDWAAFELPHMLVLNGRWISIFPPAWPAALAVAFLLHAPLLANPAVAAATVVVLHRLLRRLYDVETAHMACALLALSPAFLCMSGGVMSHPFAVLCAVSAAAAIHRAWDTHRMRWALAGGVLLNLVVLTRPFEGGLVTIGFTVYFLVRRVWRRGEAVSAFAFLAIGSSGLVVLFAYQFVLTGKLFLDPITVYFDRVYYPRSNRLGFGPDIANFGWANDALPGYSLLEAVINAHLNVELLNLELFAWPFGSLAAVALYVVNARRVGRAPDVLFVALGLTPIAGHFFYWYSGADYGARYWYEAMIPLVVLSARTLIGLDDGRGGLRRAAVVCTAMGCAVFLPWRGATKYAGYRGMGPSVARLASSCDMRRGLVFVRSSGDGLAFGGYAAGAILNRPDFVGDDPVFVRDAPPDVAARIAQAFPGRRRWTIDVPADRTRTATVAEWPEGLPASVLRACGVSGAKETVQ